MSTNAQIEANRANAQHSTGPTTSEGKAKSAANATTHGLNACPETLFAAKPQEEAKFKSLFLKLRKECQPDSDMEEATFHRFVWATFQVERARLFEEFTQDRWLDNPDSIQLFNLMERTQKIAAAQERRATKALNDLRQLQKDRFAAYEVYAEHCVLGKEVAIPKSLPTAEIRSTNLGRTSPNYLAQFLMYQTKEVKATAKQMLRDAKTNPNQTHEPNIDNPFATMGKDELIQATKDLLAKF